MAEEQNEIPTVLPWSTRLNIAVDAAKGLAFLDADKTVIDLALAMVAAVLLVLGPGACSME